MKAIKVCVVIFMVLCLVSLALTVTLCFFRENEKEKRVALEAEVVRIEGITQTLNANIDTIKAENRTLDQEVKRQIQEVTTYKNKLRDEKNVTDQLYAQIKQFESQLAQVNDEYATYKKSTSKAVDDYKAQNEQLLSRIAILKSAGRGASSMYDAKTTAVPVSAPYPDVYGDDTTGTVDLAPVVVKPATTVLGNIEVINRRFDFVVLNIGRDDGLVIGDQFGVYRDDVQIGSVRVEKLYDKLAACVIEHEEVYNPFQEGDVVGG